MHSTSILSFVSSWEGINNSCVGGGREGKREGGRKGGRARVRDGDEVKCKPMITLQRLNGWELVGLQMKAA